MAIRVPWYDPVWKRLHDKIQDGTATRAEVFEYKQIPTDDFSTNTLIMGLILVKLAKIPGGLKVIQTLGKEFLKGVFDTMHALGQASAANLVAAWANPYLVGLILRRFGFIDHQGSNEFKMGLSIISGAQVAEGFVDTLQGIFPFSSPEPSDFPSSINYSARTEGDTTTETVTAEGITLEDVKAFKKLQKQK